MCLDCTYDTERFQNVLFPHVQNDGFFFYHGSRTKDKGDTKLWERAIKFTSRECDILSHFVMLISTDAARTY